MVLVVAAVLVATACQSGQQAPSSGPTLTVAMSGDIETIDPMFSHFTRSNEVNYNIYDQFFRYDTKPGAGGVPTYDVDHILGTSIESWDQSADGLTMMLHIRKGMTFNLTGNPVTADDYIYWFDRAVGTKSGGLFNVDTAGISSWEKTGPLDVTIHFKHKSPFFFYLFRDQSQDPYDSKEIKKHVTTDDPWATKWLAKNDAGSGAYHIDHWTPGVEMVLKANPHYWRGKPYFQTVVLKIVPSESDRVLLLKQGTVDIAEGLGSDSIKSVQSASGVKVISQPTRNQVILGLNNHVAPFDNKLVRQAVSYAIPYQQVVSDIYAGQAVADSGPIPAGGRYYDKSLIPYKFDQNKAKQLLTQAGLASGFNFTVHIPTGDATLEQLTVLLQTRFKEIGINMQIQKDESAVFAQGLDARSHPAWIRDDMIWYVDDPGYTGEFMFKSNGCCDWQDYKNPRIDALVDQMLALFNTGPDLTRKTALATEYQKTLIDDAPQVYPAQTNFLLAMRSNIAGYEQGPDNLLKFYTLSRQ